MNKCLAAVNKEADILPKYQNTPVGKLLAYHNLLRSLDTYNHPEILIGMCMDYRVKLRIPDCFAYVIRVGGGDVRQSEFKISYTIGVSNIKAIALIGHNDCGMAKLAANKEKFIKGLVNNAGWNRQQAEKHYEDSTSSCSIGNEIDFTLAEADRLQELYPKILVAPLFYMVDNHRLYQIEKEKTLED